MDEDKKTKKPKKHKLVIEIGVLSIIFFTATLLFTIVLNYSVTRNSYLTSKNEMIDRDLKNCTKDLQNSVNEWYLDYIKAHSDDIKRKLTDEELALANSEDFTMQLGSYFSGENSISNDTDPDIQYILAKEWFAMNAAMLDVRLRETNYDSIYVLDILSDKESYLYIRHEPGEPDIMTMTMEDYDLEGYTTLSYTDCLRTIEYDSSKHSAVKEIVSNAPLKEGETIYEVYHDELKDKDYYIGYTPFISDGKTLCYICIQYDWSTFHSELLIYTRNSMISVFIVLFILVSLLLMYIYLKAIRPLSKVEAGVQAYMENKDSNIVSEKMSRIKVRNEIGRVADRFSDLAQEIDRHTNEILKLNSEKERIATELSLATNIQSSMLPDKFPAFPDRKEFDIFASMDPAKEVGGDFYDFFLIDDDHLAMVIADVSGKGVPAALFMMSSMILLNDHALMGGTPAEILDRINKQICKTNKAHMFVTVWLGILEISTGKLTASSAGHEFPMINTNGKFEVLRDKHGMPVGAFKKAKYKDYELTFKKGDSIFLYTDGVAEATDADNQLFGTDRTLAALNENPDAAPEELLKNVRAAVDAFVKDAPQFDDITMLGFRYFGKEENNNE